MEDVFPSGFNSWSDESNSMIKPLLPPIEDSTCEDQSSTSGTDTIFAFLCCINCYIRSCDTADFGFDPKLVPQFLAER